MSHPRSDHILALIAKIAGGIALLVGGALFVRSLPDLVRYVKMERM